MKEHGDIESFNRTFERYAGLTKKSRPEALSHAAKTLTMSLYRLLKAKASTKGAITQERLEALRNKKGLRISPAVGRKFQLRSSVSSRMVSGKSGESGVSLQRKLVEAELKFREGHRMFTAASTLFKGALESETLSRVGGAVTGKATPVAGGQNKDIFVFDWSGSVSKWAAAAATGLSKETRRQVFPEAIRLTRDDMMKYIERKQKEIAQSVSRMAGL